MTRKINRQGKVWIMVFPDKPLTKRPLEVRMGKGKGPVDKYVMNIKPGKVCFEIAGPSEDICRDALKLAQSKLPFKTKIISREGENDLF
jgi:large subunit ribosomal protein L16